MNEIDDTYKQEIESLDNDFVENHNLGKTKSTTINKYLSGVKASRHKLNEDYAKFNKKEKWKINHPKKKKKKIDKQKYLTIKHFNFKHNSFQKAIMRLDIIFFNIGRFFSKMFAILTPRIVTYAFYKISKTIRAFFRDVGYFVDRKKARIISNIKRWAKDMVEKIKKRLARLNEFISKVMAKFGKKDDGKEEGGEKKDKDKKEDDKS